MKVAVLMSTYNGDKYLKKQIDSILNQSGDFHVDLWVRDDGSSDFTKDILEQYKQDGKLQWYTGSNLKPAHSFFDLIKKCRGYDYYAFADQDDYWLEDKLQVGITQLKKLNTPALYCCNAELVDQNLCPLGREVYRQQPKLDFYTLSCAGGLLGCTMIFNKELATLLQDKPVPQKMIMHDFYIALVCLALDGQIIYDRNVYIKYRQHERNVVGVSYGKMATLYQRIKEIMTKPDITVSEQASEVLHNYKKDMNDNKRKWLIVLDRTNKSLLYRIKVACSKKTVYINWNMGLKNRIALLLGNR